MILEREAREPPSPFFSLALDLSFEYGPSLAFRFAKNTAVLQSIR